jgi:DNA-binding IclR family transcriptional regulator
MKPAALDPLARRVLRALYELAELDCPADAGVLARAVGRRPADVVRVLLVLDARGLASAERARLTLLGLAHAARVAPLLLEREPWWAEARQQARQRARALRPTASGAPGWVAWGRCAGDGESS